MVSEESPEHRGDLAASLAAVSLAAGSLVAGYRLEEQVGAGGMAVVFRARDERLGRLVALKIMAPALAADEVFRQRFIRESRLAAAVDDPHIIPVYEAGEAGRALFIAIRFVHGGDVRSLLNREGPLAPHRVAGIISPVASALDAAHAAGLVHRDVKPANILLDTRPGRPDHVYLADFGLSKGALSVTGLTGSGQFLGTPDYIAPEQIEGHRVDGRTDQYGLACAAFELLTGEVPFQRSEGMAVFWAHLSQPPPSLASRRPGLPPAADWVFARALAKAPNDRYANCWEFADALRAALGQPSGYPGAGALRAAAPPAGRSPAGRPPAGPGRSGPPPVSRRHRPGEIPIHRPRRWKRRVGLTVLVAAGCLAAIFVVLFAMSAGFTFLLNLQGHDTPPAVLYTRAGAFTAPQTPGTEHFVSSVAFSPGGKTLATGDTSGTTYLWKVGSRDAPAALRPGGGPESFNPVSGTLATVGGRQQDTIYVWGTVGGRETVIQAEHQETSVEAVAFSPDGTILASTGSNGATYLWDMAGKRVTTLAARGSAVATSVAFNPRGHSLITGTANGRAYVWDIGSGKRVGTLSDLVPSAITAVAFSPDGKTVAVSAQDGRTYLWDTATEHRSGTLSDPESRGIAVAAFSPDSKILATCDLNGSIYLWHVPADSLGGTLTNPVARTDAEPRGSQRTAVYSMAFSPAGSMLATSDSSGTTYLWKKVS